jgi:hypothetical protein
MCIGIDEKSDDWLKNWINNIFKLQPPHKRIEVGTIPEISKINRHYSMVQLYNKFIDSLDLKIVDELDS